MRESESERERERERERMMMMMLNDVGHEYRLLCHVEHIALYEMELR